MNSLPQNNQNHAAQQNCCASDIEAPASLGARATATAELLQFGSGQVGCCAGMSSGGVTGANSEVLVMLDASKFTLVNGSGVVSAGCGCSECNNLGPAAIDSESESGFDLVNLGPADCCADQRVHDGDSFIENLNLWVNEEYPNNAQAGENQGQLRKPVTITIEKDLHQKQQVKQKDRAGEHPCRCGSEANEISHKTILAVTLKTPLKVGK